MGLLENKFKGTVVILIILFKEQTKVSLDEGSMVPVCPTLCDSCPKALHHDISFMKPQEDNGNAFFGSKVPIDLLSWEEDLKH